MTYPGRSPNYRVKQEYQGLAQGTFIRPVRVYHLPKHLKESLGYYFDEAKTAPCFTPKGFMLIPWDIIEPT